MGMFCYQCQETLKNEGCVMSGVCGKNEEVANLQDLLIYILEGVAFWSEKSEALGVLNEEANIFIVEALFTTITNVNFDPQSIKALIKKGLKLRDKVRESFYLKHKQVMGEDFVGSVPEQAVWWGGEEDYLIKAKEVGILSLKYKNEDIRSLSQLLLYGLKGIAAYADHAYVLDKKDPQVFKFLVKALSYLSRENLNGDELFSLVVEAGKFGVDVMALLDSANTSAYGNPEITEVYTGTKQGPAILVSGHDLKDFEEILAQTEGKGVNVYTHGEMLPANAYPKFKKYKHLIGNYGTSWYNQQKEFEAFNGAIVMTTNCIQKPKESYKDRIFTTGLVAWPDIKHIKDRAKGGKKDFSQVIEKAIELGGLEDKEGKKIVIGFAHDAVLGVADKVVDAVKSGAIKRFVVMAGCDGRHKEREYFTKVAQTLPKDAVILTAGCAKYRYNMLDLGDIGGIPRVLDAGQCNDSYSLVVIAQKLKEVFGLKDLNDLPLSFDIGWYEQKAVIVLLALLYLGVKGIRLGPTLPAFLSKNVASAIVEKFGLKPIKNVEEDVLSIMSGV